MSIKFYKKTILSAIAALSLLVGSISAKADVLTTTLL